MVIDIIVGSPESHKFILVIEAKKVPIKEAKKQCLLAFKDIDSRNCGDVVYRFVTVGDIWQMLCYQNSKFTQTEVFHVAFRIMEVEKEK